MSVNTLEVLTCCVITEDLRLVLKGGEMTGPSCGVGVLCFSVLCIKYPRDPQQIQQQKQKQKQADEAENESGEYYSSRAWSLFRTLSSNSRFFF